MGALLEALSGYIDFLVLGAVAVAALCAPFGPRPFVTGWTYLTRSEKDSSLSIRSGLIVGALFALLYFSGYFLNAIGALFVYPAHVSIVDTVATRFDRDAINDQILGLKPAFFRRTIPVAGPFLSSPVQSELRNYWRDASRQIFWQVCDQKSADELLAGGILKELRLLRGVIGLAQILLPLCLFVIVWSLVAARRNDVRVGWPLIAWPLGTFGAALAVYVLLIIPSYTLVEYDNHVTVWTAFPGMLDKASKEAGIDVAQMDDLLPCKKMRIVAEGKNKEASGRGIQGLSPPENH